MVVPLATPGVLWMKKGEVSVRNTEFQEVPTVGWLGVEKEFLTLEQHEAKKFDDY